MTLALITYRNGPKEMEEQTSTLFFYIGGIAAITLVVNATTANQVLVALNLLGNESAEKTIVMAAIQKKLRKHMSRALQDMAIEFHLNEKELDEVRQSVSLLSDTNVEDIMAAVSMQKLEKEQKIIARKNSIRMDPRGSLSLPAFEARPEAVANPLHSGGSIELGEMSQLPPRHRDRRTSFDRNGTSTPLYGVIKEDEEDVIGDSLSEMLDVSNHTPKNNRSRGSSNADTMHRRLSMCGRGPMAMITPQLLAYVRSTFLSMVRVHYWHDIEQGKLPRKSKSGKFLLYSVEVALDEVNMEAGGRDWACVESKLDSVPHEVKALTWMEDNIPENWCTYPSRYLNKLECNREERTVYILTSFIAAHEHAQHKIHGYLRVDDEDAGDGDQQSPEEVKVIAESKLAVSIYSIYLYMYIKMLSVVVCCYLCLVIY